MTCEGENFVISHHPSVFLIYTFASLPIKFKITPTSFFSSFCKGESQHTHTLTLSPSFGPTATENAEKMDGHDGDASKQSTADMTAFVQNLLQQMQSRFQAMSESIITKIDEMGNRIDELEQSINDLRAEMGQEGSPSPSAQPKSKDEPKSADDSA
ncbi:heat shock factor-binding protein-like [Coffea arabica]|uniref:Heat shock factor-binding protein-like n=2 Tax=Coffea arabica TaxID=13443 RepID=A0A6P6WR55_COFAR|nr:heat shock factor-binding protein-like [Coffea arabica]